MRISRFQEKCYGCEKDFVHVAQSQALTAKMRALAKRGDHIRGRVGAAVKSRFGFDSTELIQCGFKPRQQVKKNDADRKVEKEREGAGS